MILPQPGFLSTGYPQFFTAFPFFGSSCESVDFPCFHRTAFHKCRKYKALYAVDNLLDFLVTFLTMPRPGSGVFSLSFNTGPVSSGHAVIYPETPYPPSLPYPQTVNKASSPSPAFRSVPATQLHTIPVVDDIPL